jgi:hypothetical protein
VRAPWQQFGMTEGKKPPSLPDIAARAAIAASPRVAGSLAVVYDGLRERHAARAAQVVDAAVSGLDPEDLAAALAADEALDAAFAAAVDAGAQSGLRAKRRLLGRVVNQALRDAARVDDAVLLVGVLAQIDAPHVRCLALVRSAEQDARAAGEVSPRARYAEREIVPRISGALDGEPAAVVVALKSLGLLDANGTYDGEVLVKGLTPFGERLLADLDDAADS